MAYTLFQIFLFSDCIYIIIRIATSIAKTLCRRTLIFCVTSTCLGMRARAHQDRGKSAGITPDPQTLLACSLPCVSSSINVSEAVYILYDPDVSGTVYRL